MRRTNISTIAVMFGLAGAAGLSEGCSQAASLCSQICDCEHCNDYREEVTCTLLETDQNVAEAYECSDEWSALATCNQDKGRCEEDDANFTTRAAGSCSGKAPSGSSCTTAADCMNGPSETCEGGMCMTRVCAGQGGNQWCVIDSDCSGDDLCASEADKLSACIEAASTHGGVDSNFNGGGL